MEKVKSSCIILLLIGLLALGEICIGENRPDGKNLIQSPKSVQKESTSTDEYTVRYLLKKISILKIGLPNSKFSIFSSKEDDQIPETQAEIAVNILGPNFIPIRTYLLRNVEEVDNIITLWDGLDMYGREAPEGMYYASLSIIYADGEKETKFFRFFKE